MDDKTFGTVIDEAAFWEPKAPETVQEPGQAVSPELNEQLNRLFQASEKLNTSETKRPTLRVIAKGKAPVFDIDGTSLEPLRTTVIGKGTFKDRYRAQLEAIVFDNNPSIGAGSLIPMMMLADIYTRGIDTVCIRSGKYRSTLKDMAVALTEFFGENQEVLVSMHKMFSDSPSIPAQ